MPAPVRQVVPIWRRPVDLVFVLFCLVNLGFVTYMIDLESLVIANPLEPFEYPLWPPQWAVDLAHWYGRVFDPLLLARPAFWQVAIWIDVLLFGPYYALAAYCFVKGKEWIRFPSYMYAATLLVIVTTIMFEEVYGAVPATDLRTVLLANAAWIAFPIFLIVRMWPKHPFTRKTPAGAIVPRTPMPPAVAVPQTPVVATGRRYPTTPHPGAAAAAAVTSPSAVSTAVLPRSRSPSASGTPESVDSASTADSAPPVPVVPVPTAPSTAAAAMPAAAKGAAKARRSTAAPAAAVAGARAARRSTAARDTTPPPAADSTAPLPLQSPPTAAPAASRRAAARKSLVPRVAPAAAPERADAGTAPRSASGAGTVRRGGRTGSGSGAHPPAPEPGTHAGGGRGRRSRPAGGPVADCGMRSPRTMALWRGSGAGGAQVVTDGCRAGAGGGGNRGGERCWVHASAAQDASVAASGERQGAETLT